jgi:ABC-2 type transporter
MQHHWDLKVVKKSILIIDEPTSKLDSHSATKLILLLQKLARAGASVLFSIHQPSSEIFQAIDHVILLHKGRVVYQGAVELTAAYFGNCGLPVPEQTNTADWIVSICQTRSNSELEGKGLYLTRNQENASLFTITKNSSTRDPAIARPYQASFWTQTMLQLKREMTKYYRHRQLFITPMLVSALVGGLLVGGVFFNVGEKPRNISRVSFSSFLVHGFVSSFLFHLLIRCSAVLLFCVVFNRQSKVSRALLP